MKGGATKKGRAFLGSFSRPNTFYLTRYGTYTTTCPGTPHQGGGMNWTIDCFNALFLVRYGGLNWTLGIGITRPALEGAKAAIAVSLKGPVGRASLPPPGGAS